MAIRFLAGKRAGVKEDMNKWGIIEIRPGVRGLNLGPRKWAKVRIRVIDEDHYIEGMGVYSDNLPEGYDAIVYYPDPWRGMGIVKNVHDKVRMNDGTMADVKLNDGIMTKVKDKGRWDEWEKDLQKCARHLDSSFIGKKEVHHAD